ncbi:hypothetical protein DMI62_22360 [Escherichia coli]|nr:hypothetical protein [Escherichia coli]
MVKVPYCFAHFRRDQNHEKLLNHSELTHAPAHGTLETLSRFLFFRV